MTIDRNVGFRRRLNAMRRVLKNLSTKVDTNGAICVYRPNFWAIFWTFFSIFFFFLTTDVGTFVRASAPAPVPVPAGGAQSVESSNSEIGGATGLDVEKEEGAFVFGDSENWPELDAPDSSSLRFRVENTVRYSENEQEFVLKTSTIFCDDLVFDFIGDNGEIVVFSFSTEKFTLIDPIRRLRTEISLDEIERFLDKIKERLATQKDGFCDFMLDPTFDVSQKEDELLFQSKWIDYRATTRDFSESRVSAAYYRFMNALCKLNVYTNPGTITPFARLAINRRFEADVRFPEKIVVDVYPRGKFFFHRAIQIENEHKIAMRLSEKDRNRIVRAVYFAVQFQEINFRSYYEKVERQ